MYDEIDVVQKTLEILKDNNCISIVIQSDPNDSSKCLEDDDVSFYQKLPDLAASEEEYLKEMGLKPGVTIGSRAITRNYSVGFTAAQSFEADWWVAITGDVEISNLNGVKEIIEKMISNKKSLGVFRAVGQTFWNSNKEFTRVQRDNTTDFFPQLIIVKSSLVKKKLFSEIKITNSYGSEQCLGDEVKRFCDEEENEFENIVFIISNYAYPQFISGLKFNSDRINMPRYVDGFVNMFRRMKTRHMK